MDSIKYDIEPDNSLKCSLCLEVARNPVQHGATGCGKLFCKECIDKHGNKPCPMCRGKDPEYFEDAKSSREIQALRVKCHQGECTWKGTLAELEKHVDNNCEYTIIIGCPNQCTSFQGKYHTMRKYLERHLAECPNRLHSCLHCGKEGTYASVTEKHEQECSKKPIPCPNSDCTITIERERVQQHVDKCEHSIVYCKYNDIGCTEKRKRKDIKIHEDYVRAHLHLLLKQIPQLDRAQQDMSKTIKEMSTAISELQGEKTIYFDIPGYAERKGRSQEVHSNPFFTVPNGYKMSVCVACNGRAQGEGSHVSLYTQLLSVPYKRQLKWPFKGTVTFELLNQLADEDHQTYVLHFINNDGARVKDNGWGVPKFIPHSRLSSYNEAANIQYLVNNTLHFRVTVQEKNDRPWLP